MVEIVGVSRAARPRRRLSWVGRIALVLRRPLRRPERAARLDEQAWSSYMLRDVGLGGGPRERDRWDLWPLR